MNTNTDKTEYFKFLEGLEEWGISDYSLANIQLMQQFPELDMANSRIILQEWHKTRKQLLQEG
jgi:hypothetical protein